MFMQCLVHSGMISKAGVQVVEEAHPHQHWLVDRRSRLRSKNHLKSDIHIRTYIPGCIVADIFQCPR